jgi:hypothetical protein
VDRLLQEYFQHYIRKVSGLQAAVDSGGAACSTDARKPKPCMEVRDGIMEPAEKCRGLKKSAMDTDVRGAAMLVRPASARSKG